MFIRLQLPENEPILLNTSALKSIGAVSVRASGGSHGIQFEFIRKEKDWVAVFDSEHERDIALGLIADAISSPDSTECVVVDNVEEVVLYAKGWNDSN